MIATIICSALVILTIIIIIIDEIRDPFWQDWFSNLKLLLCCITSLFVMATLVALMIGYDSSRDVDSEDNKDLRELIEYRIENDEVVNPDTIKKIERYNVNLTEGNNYFCRFSLRDVDNYLIDLNVYLNKFNKQA